MAVSAAALVLLLLTSSAASAGQETGEQAGPKPWIPSLADLQEAAEQEPLAKKYVRWLEEIDPIISLTERKVFLGLQHDHHREAFIRQFWRERDPYPQTARNEMKENWEERIYIAETEYGGLDDDRSRILLVHGTPQGTMEVRCTKTRVPIIVWYYTDSDVIDYGFLLVFLRQAGTGPARLWRPTGGGLGNLISNSRSCINGGRMSGVINAMSVSGYDRTFHRIISKPKPRSEEWVATFVGFTTDISPDAPRFDAKVDYAFLGRYQNRTVVQGAIQILKEQAAVGEFAGFRSHDFRLTGEVVIGDQLFETFRYKFGFSADETQIEVIPLAFQRFLRPGDYRVVLKLEDLNAQSYFRHEVDLVVPLQEDLATIRDDLDNESIALFREATATISQEHTAIRIVPPIGNLHSGRLRFDTLASGGDIDDVTFFLDGREILTKNHPPYNVEIDLGPFPRVRKLRAVAHDGNGLTVAEDEILLNAGEHRFGVRLLEPRAGETYRESLQARAEVDVPPGETLERVEFFLNEQLVATLYQEPFAQPIRLPKSSQVSYVRAVAHLVDGNAIEDLVFVNSPDYLEKVEVQFVELFTAVLDPEGRPIENLRKEEVTVLEDGVRQDILRFERVEDLPIHAVILLDNSASMAGVLGRARKAALQFFQQTLEPRDRAAVITFNRFPEIAVKFTNDPKDLGASLQGLTAEGQTALYDSIMFSLYYFSGIKGQRALLLLSDGKDEVSRFAYAETLEYARRAGVTIYSIWLNVEGGGPRSKLVNLANETGGRSYFIRDVGLLEGIYELIERDMRSQYLIAYQSHNSEESNVFRALEVEIDRPKTSVRTLSGYYP